MGTVVLHAGMRKAGSTSIQTWLADNVSRLLEEDTVILTPGPAEDRRPDSRVELREYRPEHRSRTITGRDLFYPYRSGGGRPVFERFVAQLDAFASRHKVVVVSGEGFESLFWGLNADLLEPLEEVARSHPVRVAYYVRPQHEALESRWRHWGFRTRQAPSTYIPQLAPALRYLDTYQAVRQRAPGISFEPRPFRRDLLEFADPALDFATCFLGRDTTESKPTWSNRGLPLELANALRRAPEGLLWDSLQDNKLFNLMKTLLVDVESVETEETIRSRRLLQAYSHHVFEPENGDLIRELDWETEEFVPPVSEPHAEPAELLDMIDELWAPRASRAELDLLYAALAYGLHLRSSARAQRPKPALIESAPRRRFSSRAVNGARSLRRSLRKWSARPMRSSSGPR